MNKIFLLILSVIVTCHLTAQQRMDITKPMFGEAESDERFQLLVSESRKAALEQFGSIDSAVTDMLNKAWAFFCQNDLEMAMRRFNQAWILNPDFPDAYFGFAALLEMKGNYTEANRLYFLGAENDRQNRRTILCYQQIATCKEQVNDLKGAADVYLKIRMVKPDDPFVFKKLGYLYMMLGENVSALEAFAKALELDSQDATTFYYRAAVYQAIDDNAKAILDYTHCVLLEPTYTAAYVNRGILEMKRNFYEFGKQDFETAIRLDGKSGQIRRLLGIAKLSLDDKQGACEDFVKAKELGDADADALLKEYCK